MLRICAFGCVCVCMREIMLVLVVVVVGFEMLLRIIGREEDGRLIYITGK